MNIGEIGGDQIVALGPFDRAQGSIIFGQERMLGLLYSISVGPPALPNPLAKTCVQIEIVVEQSFENREPARRRCAAYHFGDRGLLYARDILRCEEPFAQFFGQIPDLCMIGTTEGAA